MCHFVLHAVSVQLNVYCEMLTMSRLFVALKESEWSSDDGLCAGVSLAVFVCWSP